MHRVSHLLTFVVLTAAGACGIAGCYMSPDSDDSSPSVREQDSTEAERDTGVSSQFDTSDTSDAGPDDAVADSFAEPDSSADTGRQMDTYEPEPQRVEGPVDRRDYRCRSICSQEGLTCTDRCENDDGETVVGMAIYITNISGEVQKLPQEITSCGYTVEYKKTRQLRRSFWCCCQ